MDGTFKTSGALGDIIYAIPTIQSLCDKAELCLVPDVVSPIPAWAGKRQEVLCTREQMESLFPLLNQQPVFRRVMLHDQRSCHYDLDAFRSVQFDFSRWSIMHYHQLVYPESSPDFSLPWLSVEPSDDFKDQILVNRTCRYRNENISYKWLAGRSDVTFVGTAEESNVFAKDCGRVPCVRAEDALQLARWIAGCKLFIGNQSFAFALAEALKVWRMLEVYPKCPNVIPQGPNAISFVHQAGLEMAFGLLTI